MPAWIILIISGMLEAVWVGMGAAFHRLGALGLSSGLSELVTQTAAAPDTVEAWLRNQNESPTTSQS